MNDPTIAGDEDEFEAFGFDDDELVVVAVGNPFDGMQFFGPFGSADEAEGWCADMDEEWWLVHVAQPFPLEDNEQEDKE